MKNTQHCLSAALIACGFMAYAPVANADDYQMQATAKTSHYAGDGYSYDYLEGVLTYYFSPVKTAGLPLAEAAFLGRNSSVSVFAFRELTGTGVAGHELMGEFWVNDFYVFADYGKNPGIESYVAKVGYMVNDGLLLSLSANGSDFDSNVTYYLEGKYVGKLGEHFVGLDATLSKDQGDYYTRLRGEYFFTQAFSLNASASKWENSDPRYGLGAQYFINPKFSLGLQHVKQGSNKSTTLDANFRF